MHQILKIIGDIQFQTRLKTLNEISKHSAKMQNVRKWVMEGLFFACGSVGNLTAGVRASKT